MKRYIDGHDIANTVRMMRSHHTGAILLVEGDTDSRVYRRFVNEQTCQVLPANGKANALNAIELLDLKNIAGILVIIDSDFWRLEGKNPDSQNLLTTDTHDLETMIISSAAFDKVLVEFASQPKMKKIGVPVRELLLEIGKPIGYFRWIASSSQDKLALKFKDISFDRIIDRTDTSARLNIDEMIKEVLRDTPNSTAAFSDIKQRITTLLSERKNDAWQVCRGHDMVKIFFILLVGVIGKNQVRRITLDIIDGMLRIAYEFDDFRKTELYNSIKTWERNNPDYRILE